MRNAVGPLLSIGLVIPAVACTPKPSHESPSVADASVSEPDAGARVESDVVFHGAFSALLGVDPNDHSMLLFREATPREPNVIEYLTVDPSGQIADRLRLADGAYDLGGVSAKLAPLAARFRLRQWITINARGEATATGGAIANPVRSVIRFLPDGTFEIPESGSQCVVGAPGSSSLATKRTCTPDQASSSMSFVPIAPAVPDDMFGSMTQCLLWKPPKGPSHRMGCLTRTTQPHLWCDNGICGLFAQDDVGLSFALADDRTGTEIAQGSLYGSEVSSFSVLHDRVAISISGGPPSTVVIDAAAGTARATRRPFLHPASSLWRDDRTLLLCERGDPEGPSDPGAMPWTYQATVRKLSLDDADAWVEATVHFTRRADAGK